MSLTRKLLKELELNDDAIERIIAAHVETVDALRQERDAAQAQCDAQQGETAVLQAEYTAYRGQVEEAQRLSARREALTQALTAQGANPNALPLLLDAIRLPEEAWQDNKLTDANTSLQPWRAKYGALFTVRNPVPVQKIRPPVTAGGLLTHADVKRMSAGDINRNWSAVRTALQGNKYT